MTSEAPQQPGWPPADPADQQGGYGLFEAPPAPEGEFPVFTPFGGAAEQVPPDEVFPPDSEADSGQPAPFAGFPAEPQAAADASPQWTPEPAAQDWTSEPAEQRWTPEPAAPQWASEPAAQSWSEEPAAQSWSEEPAAPGNEPLYVPAPAVMPIPGVKHEMPNTYTHGEPFAAATAPAEPDQPGEQAWPDYSDYADREPAQPTPDFPQRQPFATLAGYDEPPAVPDALQSLSTSGSWSAFDTGEAKNLDGPATSWTPPETTPSHPEPPAAAPQPAALPEPMAVFPPAQSEPVAPVAFEPVASAAFEQAAQAVFEPAVQAPFEPAAQAPFEAAAQAAFAPAEPVAPSVEPASAAPVVAVARVAAASAVPATSRIAPSDSPVSLPKPAPRVYGSAAAQAPVDDAAAQQQPAPGTPTSAPPADAPAVPQQVIGAPAQPVRATARASVSVPQAAQMAPAAADPQVKPPITRSSTVYGAPPRAADSPAQIPGQTTYGQADQGHVAAVHGAAAPQAVTGAQAPARPNSRQPAYGDLLGPAVPAAPNGPPNSMPPMPAGQPGGLPQVNPVPAQRAPQGMAPGMPSGPGFPGGPGMPSGPTEASKFDRFKPDEPSIALEVKPVRSGRLIIGVVIGCALLLALAFGVLYGVDKLTSSDPTPAFKVGDCFRQDGAKAVPSGCGEAGAFTVVAVVDARSKCEDQAQPTVEVGSQVFCLKPVTAPGK